MDKEQIIQLIKEELSNFKGIDRYIFDKNIQILNARNIQLGRTAGTQIGTATDQLLGFYGTTPVNQPDTVADAETQGGTYSQTDVQSIATAVNALIARLKETGLIA